MGLIAGLLPHVVTRWLNKSLWKSSSDRLARVFYASPDWIVITRLSDSLIVEVNQGFETLSGYSAQEAIGKHMSKFNIWVHPEQREQIVSQLTTHGIVRNAHAKVRRRDGALRDLQLSVLPEATHVLDWYHLTRRLTVLASVINGKEAAEKLVGPAKPC